MNMNSLLVLEGVVNKLAVRREWADDRVLRDERQHFLLGGLFLDQGTNRAELKSTVTRSDFARVLDRL